MTLNSVRPTTYFPAGRRRLIAVFSGLVVALGMLVAAPAPTGAETTPWSTAPKRLDVANAPATVTGIRVGSHPTYDRVVIDMRGPLPGYFVRYVRQFAYDPSGRLVDLR